MLLLLLNYCCLLTKTRVEDAAAEPVDVYTAALVVNQ